MQGWSKGVIYSGVTFLAVGMLMIVLAWNGAASLDYTQGQIPYLISGGVGGLALVGAGLALIVVHSLRRDLLVIAAKLDRMSDVVDLQSAAALGGSTTAPEGNLRVVAGRTTFHLPTCRLVAGRSDLPILSAQAARDRRLTPCRICKPTPAA